MIRVSEVIHGWLGWCPNHPAMQFATAISPAHPEITHVPAPQDPPGRPGRIRTGAGIATDSIRTLLREKSLLWFSACAGLVIAFMFLSLYAVHVLTIYPYEMISVPVGIVLTFCIEFVSTSALCYLFAGLVFSTPEEPGRQVIRNKMSAARNSLKSILIWSAILSVIITSVYTIQTYYFTGVTSGIFSVLAQFPFFLISLPEVYGPGPIAGGFHMIAALSSTLTLMALTILFMILTLFVVPSLVLGRKTLRSAAKESLSRIKVVWKETCACLLVFFLILLAMTVPALLLPGIYQITTLGNQLTWYPGDGWVITAFLYMAAWTILVILGLTAAGIAATKLYCSAGSGRIPGTQNETGD
ncbi:MAG: hypothetical protein LUQ31_02025 [Methanoregula sp.]|nr:hypothetical protein [Methanoregula sp.]